MNKRIDNLGDAMVCIAKCRKEIFFSELALTLSWVFFIYWMIVHACK